MAPSRLRRERNAYLALRRKAWLNMEAARREMAAAQARRRTKGQLSAMHWQRVAAGQAWEGVERLLTLMPSNLIESLMDKSIATGAHLNLVRLKQTNAARLALDERKDSPSVEYWHNEFDVASELVDDIGDLEVEATEQGKHASV